MRKERANASVGQKVTKHNFKGSLSLVIPCYNESKRVGHLLKTLNNFEQNWATPLEIIIVDDGSSDDTVQKIESSFKGAFGKHTTFQLLQFEHNQGKGAALKTGVKNSTADYVLTIDADMAAEPQELTVWLDQLPDKTFSENKILIGSREHENSKIKGQLIRRFAGLVYNFIIQLFTNLNLTDTQCGFKLYPKAIAKSLFDQLQTLGWAHDIELLNQAKFEGIPIQPMPLKWTHQDDSKISLVSDSIKMLFSTIGISFRQNWNWFITQPIKDFKKVKAYPDEPSWYRLLFAITAIVLFFIWSFKGFDFGSTNDELSEVTHVLAQFIQFFMYFLMMLFSGLLAKEASGSWRVAFLALIFTAFSPFIFGQDMSNLIDIPFAMAYAFTLLHLTRFLHQLPKPGSKTIVMLIIGLSLTISLRVEGLALVIFFGIFTAISYLIQPELRQIISQKRQVRKIIIIGLLVTLFSCFGALLGAYLIDALAINPALDIKEASNYSLSSQKFFEENHLWSGEYSWYDIPRYIGILSLFFLIIGLPLFLFFYFRKNASLSISLIAFAVIVPIVYMVFKAPSLSEGMWYFSFVYPLLVILAAWAWNRIIALQRN